MKPKMARKPRPTDEVSSPPLSPTSGRMMHKKRRIDSESTSPARKMSTASTGDKAVKQSPKGPKHKEPIVRECKVPKEEKPMSPLPPIHVDEQQPCSSTAAVTSVQAPPEFLAFVYNVECPTLRAVLKAEEALTSIRTEVLRALQHELEAMLAHTMDFMRRAAGDLQFLETGDYPMVNLKNRSMPCYQMRQAPNSPMSPTTQVHHEISLRSLLIPPAHPDEDVDVWPPPHMATRYQSYKAMEKEENVIDKKALDEYAQFMEDEMNEVDFDFTTVDLPEYRHRLRYASMVDVFSEFERRLHDQAMQLQQMDMGRNGARVVYNNCARSSTWWSNPMSSLGAAEAFSRNYRAKNETFVTERRVKMMRVNLLPSLAYQSIDEKRAAAELERSLLEENKSLKKQLKKVKEVEKEKGKKAEEMKKEEKRKLRAENEAEERRLKEAEEKAVRGRKKAPVTPSKDSRRNKSAVRPSSSPRVAKPTTPSKTTPSSSRDVSSSTARKPVLSSTKSSLRPLPSTTNSLPQKTFMLKTKAGSEILEVPAHLRKATRLVVVKGGAVGTRVMGMEEAEDWAYGRQTVPKKGLINARELDKKHPIAWRQSRADGRIKRALSRARSVTRMRSRSRRPRVNAPCGLLSRRSRSAPLLPVVPIGKLRLESTMWKNMERLGVEGGTGSRVLSLKMMREGAMPPLRKRSQKSRTKKGPRKASRSPIKKRLPPPKTTGPAASAASKTKPTSRKASPTKASPRQPSPQKKPQQPAAAAATIPKKAAAAVAASTPKKAPLAAAATVTAATPQRVHAAAAAATPKRAPTAAVTPNKTPEKLQQLQPTTSSVRPQRMPQKAAAAADAVPTLTPQAMKTPARRSSPMKSPAGSPTKPAPVLPKSPIPSPTPTRRTTERRGKAIERREEPPKEHDESPNGLELAPNGREETPKEREETQSPLVPNGVEKETTPLTQRRSTRDRKPSLKIQQSQLPLSHYFQSNSRKSSAKPEPTPEPVVVLPVVAPVVANGVGSPHKEEMPVLSPMGMRISSRRMTRNSMDAAMIPPVLQVQQVLLQQQKQQQLQQPPPLSPGSPPPQLSPHKKAETPKKTPNGLMSPMTRRRASLEEKEKREREEMDKEEEIKEEEPMPVLVEEKEEEKVVECKKRKCKVEEKNKEEEKKEEEEKVEEKRDDGEKKEEEKKEEGEKKENEEEKDPVEKKVKKKKETPKKAPRKMVKKVRRPPTTSFLCVKRLRELKKMGEKVCMRTIMNHCKRNNISLKTRLFPQSMMKRRGPSRLDEKIRRLVTPSPTRYMLSDSEAKKMGLIRLNKEHSPVEKKICKKICLKKLMALARKKAAEMRRRQREKEAKAVCWMVPDAIRRELLRTRILNRMKAMRKEITVFVHRFAGEKRAAGLSLFKGGRYVRRRKVVKMFRGRRIVRGADGKQIGKKPSTKVPSKIRVNKKRVMIRTPSGSGKKGMRKVKETKEKGKKEKKVKKDKKEEVKEVKKKDAKSATLKKPLKSALKSSEKKKEEVKKDEKKEMKKKETVRNNDKKGKSEEKKEKKVEGKKDDKRKKNVQLVSGKEKKGEERKRNEEKKVNEKKEVETATVLFKGRMPKLIEGPHQWAQFIKKKNGKPLIVGIPPLEVEKKKQPVASKSNSRAKNGQRRRVASPKKNVRTKKVEEVKKEEEVETRKIVIKVVRKKGSKKEKRRKEKKRGEKKKEEKMREGKKTRTNRKKPNGLKEKEKSVKKKPTKKVRIARKEKEVEKGEKKLNVCQIRNMYLLPIEDRMTYLYNQRRKAAKGRFIKILRAGIHYRSLRSIFVRLMRVMRRIRRRRQNQAARVIPAIDMSVPHLNECRPGAGWPVEWTIQKSLRAPGIYRRRRLKAVRRLRRAAERREKQKEEQRKRAELAAAGIAPLRKMPWERPPTKKTRGSVGMMKSAIGACHMEEGAQTARAIDDIKRKARKKVMDIIFDTVMNGGKIQNIDEPEEEEVLPETEKAEEAKEEEKAEEKKEEEKEEETKEEKRPRRNSIRGRKDIPVKEESEPEVEEEKMDETLDFEEKEGNGEEEMGETEDQKPPVPRGKPYVSENEVAIELAIAQLEYKKALESYNQMLLDIFYIMGAREYQIRARKHLEEKEDELYSLHAKFYREVPRRLPNNQEMAQIAAALTERRQAMIKVFGANLWRQPRIQPDHPAWLTATYKEGAKRQDKYNYFTDWEYDSKREMMRAHEKMFAVATSHHLPESHGYSKYTMARGRDATTLYEWEKELVAGILINKRKCQKKVIGPSARRLRDIPKRPPTAASLERMEEERKRREEKEEREEREREPSGETYSFGSDDDEERKKDVEMEKDEWDEEEERKKKERESTPPPVPIPPQWTSKRRHEKREILPHFTLPLFGRSARVVLEPEDEEAFYPPSIASSESSIWGEEEGEEMVEEENGLGGIEGDTEVKEIIKKLKKDKRVVMQDSSDKKVDRRKVGGLDLPVSISHLDPSVFLALIPDNRSHKKGQGKKAMLKQIMIEYAAKEKAAVASGKPQSEIPLPRKPQQTQQQLMSPGGTSTVAGDKARGRRSIISPQGSERSERSDRTRERSEKSSDKSGGGEKAMKNEKEKEKKDKKKKKKEIVIVKEEPMEVEEMTPIREKKKEVRAHPTPRLSSPSTPKAYGARRACTKKEKMKEEDDEDEDDFGMKVPYTPAASRRGGHALPSPVVAAAATAAAAAPSTPLVDLSPLPMRSCRRRTAVVKYDDDDDPVIISPPTTNRRPFRKIKQEVEDDY